MEGLYLGFLLCIAGAGGVLGTTTASVNLTLSDPAPSEGDNQVVMTCVFSPAADNPILFVYFDKLVSQHDGYTILVRYNVISKAVDRYGVASEDRASVEHTNNTLTLTLSSVSCADTSHYKCDLTLQNATPENNYNINVEDLSVKDSTGVVCGGAFSTMNSSSLLVLLFILFANVLLR